MPGAELLQVSGAADARAALDAARSIQLFDGRSAAWSVVRRSLWAGGAVISFLGLQDSPVVPMLLLGFAVASLGVVAPTWWARRCGAEPRMSPRLVAGAVGFVVWLVIMLLFLVLGERWALDVVVVGPLALAYTFTPAVRAGWVHLRTDPTRAWPPGAEAFAVLAALEQVYWMHPDRLAAVVAMPADVTDTWVQAVRSVGALADRTLALSPAGRALLDRWRADLEQLAQPCTDSTAPTSPDVSSDRSSSDVT
jgi:hypothetical protein